MGTFGYVALYGFEAAAEGNGRVCGYVVFSANKGHDDRHDFKDKSFENPEDAEAYAKEQFLDLIAKGLL